VTGKRSLFILLVLVALLFEVFVQGDSQAASVAVPQWQVVWATNDGGLSLMTSKATRPRILVKPTSGWDVVPLLSPDGNWVAFFHDSKNFTTEDLEVVRVNGGAARRLLRIPSVSAESLTWAPDSRSLAFVDFETLAVVSLDARARRVNVAAQANEFSWSPDARRLTYASFGSLYSTTRAGSATRLLARGRASTALYAPTWSPDGRLIAYKARCVNPGANDVFCDAAVMNADGSGKRFLTSGQPYGPDPIIWSRDSWSIFVSLRPGIVMLNVRTRAARTLNPAGQLVAQAADGRAIGVLQRSRLLITTLGGRIIQSIPLPPGFDFATLDVRLV
jgi:hypothetical protein